MLNTLLDVVSLVNSKSDLDAIIAVDDIDLYAIY